MSRHWALRAAAATRSANESASSRGAVTSTGRGEADPNDARRSRGGREPRPGGGSQIPHWDGPDPGLSQTVSVLAFLDGYRETRAARAVRMDTDEVFDG